MSLKKQLHKALSSALMNGLQFSDIPSCQWVDKDFGQAEMMQKGELVFPLPAVLIAFPAADYENMLSIDQTGEIQIRLKVMFENYLDSSEGNINQDIALQFFDFNERVNQAMDLFKHENLSGLALTNESEDDNHTNVIVSTLTYQATIFKKGTDNSQEVNATGNLIISKVNVEPKTYDTGFVIPGT
jgi:hypothetical protein